MDESDAYLSAVHYAPDGSTKELAFTICNPNLENLGYSSSTYTGNAECYCTVLTEMDGDGDWNNSIVLLTERGLEVPFYEVYPAVDTASIFAKATAASHSIRGDLILCSQIPLDGEPDMEKENWNQRSYDQYYQLCADVFRKITLPVAYEDFYGAYISGDTMYYYRANDGFYCRDIASGQEEKVMDAAYADARGYSLDGCLMIESTLAVPGQSPNAGAVHLRYFDGERWYELHTPGDWTVEYAFRPIAATSDRIFFTIYDSTLPYAEQLHSLYYITLGTDEMVHRYDFPSFYDFSG